MPNKRIHKWTSSILIFLHQVILDVFIKLFGILADFYWHIFLTVYYDIYVKTLYTRSWV